MSKLLVSLLGVNQDKFGDYIESLESVALRPGIDVRLAADVVSSSRNRITQLGLNVETTSARHVYDALLARLAEDDVKITTKLGIYTSNVEQAAVKIAAQADELSGQDHCMAIMPSGIKRLLKAVPPKRTLRLLKYRSIDSVVKRYDARVLYALACAVENESWRTQIVAKMRRLEAKHIQWQSVHVLTMPVEWYRKAVRQLASSGVALTNNETGVVCVLPVVDVNQRGSTLLSLGLVLQAATHISTQSIPYRARSLADGFNNSVVRISSGEVHVIDTVYSMQPTWRVVHELIGDGHVATAADVFAYDSFDLYWESTESKLAAIDETMDFWVGGHFVGVKTDQLPVSMHVLDVALCLAARLRYEDRLADHCVASLWNELHIRYLKEDVLARSLAQQLSEYSSAVVL